MIATSARPLEFQTATEAETRILARDFAAQLRPGSIVALTGDLGSGKTVFVRGLAEGLGLDPAQVASPTFSLLQEYVDWQGRVILVHLDLYRVADEEHELREIGLPDLLDGRVAAVEWPREWAARLLRVSHRVHLCAAGDRGRRITIEKVRP